MVLNDKKTTTKKPYNVVSTDREVSIKGKYR